jgi:hypoxanthine phosphoribosyltransferase
MVADPQIESFRQQYDLPMGLLKEILITPDAVQARVAELGAQITRDYADSSNLLLVAVLKGSVVFLTDLMRHIRVPHGIDFMAVSSYGVHARETTGVVRIDMDLKQEIAGREVLLVEDIVDSGTTLSYICGLLLARQPKRLQICSLLSKPSRRTTPIDLAYVGFEIENKFVFGYGLDLDELYRNLPFVGVVETTE